MKTTDRKFETWDWMDKSTTPKPLQFEVRLERPVNVAEGPIRYYIKHDDPPIRIEANDLGPLREKLDAAVRAFYAVEWTPVLAVRMAKGIGLHRQAPSFELKLEIVEYERGMLHGQPVHRKLLPSKTEAHAKNFEYAITMGDLDREFREFRNDKAQKQWVLHDTDEMRALLLQFDDRAAELLGLMERQLVGAEVP